MTLVIESLTIKLGKFTLPELDLEVREGEYFVLLGPSGVGKSVLLEVIAGLIQPDSGTVSWKGRDVTAVPPESRGFAIVYQDYCLFPHMTVRANIEYGLKTKLKGREEIDERVDSLAELMNIQPLLDRLPETLSGGEEQRIALARALAVSPELLLLDEPLSAVDLEMRRRLRRELKMLQAETGTTFLHVTHDVDEAVVLGQRIGVMLGGRVHQVGTPVELFQHPSDHEVAGFLGIKNILAVTSSNGDFCEVGGEWIHVGARQHPFNHIWIRPEEIILSAEPFKSSARNQLECIVEEWELRDVFVSVKASRGGLSLTALITFTSFEELGIKQGETIYATFKSSSIHCF